MDQYLDILSEQIRQSCKLTAVGIGVLKGGQDPKIAVAGRRHEKSNILLEKNDRWHVGSITKSMTATLVASQISEGRYGFDTSINTLLDHIPIHPSKSDLTIKQLLTHTAKLQANFSWLTRIRKPEPAETNIAYRARLISDVLQRPASSKQVHEWLYSNVGYAVAGHVAETVAKLEFELLMQREIFAKCNMRSAGFGAPQGKTRDDEPMGHSSILGIRRYADPYGTGFTDNGIELSAAGRAHMSLCDLLRYGQIHLDTDSVGLLGISAKNWTELHTPQKRSNTPRADEYACGWVVEDHDDWSGRILWHNGSNTLWYALLMLLPAKNMILAFTTNNGSVVKAEQAFFHAAKDIVSRM